MLNLNDTRSTGPLTDADMERAAKLRSYQPWPARRLAAGCDQQGRYETRQHRPWPDPAEACTEVGADTRPAALSMARHKKAGRIVLALIAAPGFVAIVAVAAFLAQHWPF